VNFQASTQPQTTNTNGNGVDSDETSADLAQNGLLYDALAEVVTSDNTTLQYAMGIG
jgi:flagellar basal body rod protein FlgB